VLGRPALIPVPAAGPQLLLGAEGARELALASQLVRPSALTAAGHSFRYPSLEGALRHVLGRTGAPAPASSVVRLLGARARLPRLVRLFRDATNPKIDK
jgi:hypothetical protein